MPQPSQRQTKKQKKALAFRTRQKAGKRNSKNFDDDDEDALDFPVDENQDLAGLAVLPLEAEEVSAGNRSGGQEGKAPDGDKRQAQSDCSKKRKREGEDAVDGKPRKKSKVQPKVLEQSVEGDDGREMAKVKTKKEQPQRFILFIGGRLFCSASRAMLTHDDRRQLEVLYDKGRYSFPLLLMWYDIFTT